MTQLHAHGAHTDLARTPPLMCSHEYNDGKIIRRVVSALASETANIAYIYTHEYANIHCIHLYST